mgnify:FL=1
MGPMDIAIFMALCFVAISILALADAEDDPYE